VTLVLDAYDWHNACFGGHGTPCLELHRQPYPGMAPSAFVN